MVPDVIIQFSATDARNTEYCDEYVKLLARVEFCKQIGKKIVKKAIF
jgi:hypothetical protein